MFPPAALDFAVPGMLCPPAGAVGGLLGPMAADVLSPSLSHVPLGVHLGERQQRCRLDSLGDPRPFLQEFLHGRRSHGACRRGSGVHR